MPRRPDLPPLHREDLAPDPFAQFAAWFEQAAAEVPLPEAMTLATVDREGMPDARMVLLKGAGPDGFHFFTNYESAKGRQLEGTGRGAIVVYWRELDRQVRARGSVERLPSAESDAYFASRSRDSQIGAWASPQSRPLISRDELDREVEEVAARFGDGPVERPPHWGGYLLMPDTVEFWQGQVGRLHDRFRYSQVTGGGWMVERLGP
ncbi:MAG: pyridoxamine 5-phosphate oxidase [Solirubrobacterales bacterium]|jgi:pyridoxamine 5'-phosphate oxidase|nr:pyridoxamine 5-phosphate oxidase [Solirubrobacterales bacterium]